MRKGAGNLFRGIRAAFLVSLLLFPFSQAAWAAQAGQFVPSSLWQPPDLSGAGPESPELLVLSIAQEEIGYREGPLEDQSKYGEWLGEKQAAWCSELLTWCVGEADRRFGTSLLNGLYPGSATASSAFSFYLEQGRFVSGSGRLPTNEKQWDLESRAYLSNHSYIPRPGDYMWLSYYQRRKADHAAIVEGVSMGVDGVPLVHVIEGNNPDAVQRSAYALTDASILGFGTPVKRVMSNLRLYNRGADVLRLAEMLRTSGYLAQGTKVQDEYTREIRSAVASFQRAAGQEASGIVDMETWLALESQATPKDGSP